MGLGKLGNAFPTMLLRSPLHHLMSRRYLLLTFVGRKSGRSYQTPVAYLRQGDEIIITTDSRWWLNLLKEPRVLVTVKGTTTSATARVVQDNDQSVEGLAALVESIPFYGKFAHVRRDEQGRADHRDVRRAIDDGRVLISLELDPPPPTRRLR